MEKDITYERHINIAYRWIRHQPNGKHEKHLFAGKKTYKLKSEATILHPLNKQKL